MTLVRVQGKREIAITLDEAEVLHYINAVYPEAVVSDEEEENHELSEHQQEEEVKDPEVGLSSSAVIEGFGEAIRPEAECTFRAIAARDKIEEANRDVGRRKVQQHGEDAE